MIHPGETTLPYDFTCIATSVGFAVVGWMILTSRRSYWRMSRVTAISLVMAGVVSAAFRAVRLCDACSSLYLFWRLDLCTALVMALYVGLDCSQYTWAQVAGTCFASAWLVHWADPCARRLSCGLHVAGHFATLALCMHFV